VRNKKLRNMEIKEYLIKWKNLSMEDATLEGEHVLQKKIQNFLLKVNL
jgi:hypothetical protein